MTFPARRRLVGVLVSVALALPVLAQAGDASAAPAPVRPAAAPASNGLAGLANLLNLLFPSAPPASPLSPVQGRVAASTVRVNGVACGVRVAGSGFTPAADTVVTNAHVVAGVTSPTVLRPDGRVLPATVQVFDPVRDLAVLHVAGLAEPALALGSAPAAGETDAVFGHPGGQAALRVAPAQVLRRVTTDVGDIYDKAPSVRQILILNSQLAPGDSGSPLVDSAGRVVGVAFAIASFRRSTAFAIASEELAPVLAQPRGAAVGTGPCIA